MIQASQLTKKYDQKIALDGLTITVNPGSIYSLLGANGAGKTTTINLFLHFITPSAGTATVDGLDVTKDEAKVRQRVAYIPENLMLYPQLTGIENLEYFSALAGKKYSVDDLRQFLSEAGLQGAAHSQRIHSYSKGMRQKVGIAIALAKQAKALLLDEPTSGLDPKASNEFAALLQKLSAQGVATLMATHDLFRAIETGTHIGIMKEGKLVQELAASEVNHAELEKLYLQHMN